MGKKKAFLNKKNAVHYRLIPKTAAESLSDEGKRFIPTQEHLEEQHKYGIFFDDDYDYMQHLRDVRETGTLQSLEEATEQERCIIRAPKLQPQKPSVLFGETVGCIAKKEEEEIFDEDVEQALEGNFDGEIGGGLEDDFIALAGGLAEPTLRSHIQQHRESTVHFSSDEEEDEESNYSDSTYSDEEKEKKMFEEVGRDGPRREIDDRFDQLLEGDYHDDQLGELDGDDFRIGGMLEPNDERVKRMVKESNGGPIDDEQASKSWTRQRVRLIEANVIKNDEVMEDVEVDEAASKRLKWDCESYATQYSNIYNHPTVIRSGKLSRGALKRFARESSKVDEMEVEDEEMKSNEDDSMSQCTQASTYRPKGETSEQRRLRKQAVKEARRFRRQEKKGNKLAFAEERRKVVKERVGQIKTVPMV
ncbi:hypothetical protein RB195_005050 [Necator americanus]|uniref:Protein LTV1 homolog n=1 Tax=Necator americanus TaxID=51031 RepID=A0ABR1BKZ0_NECAM